MLLILLAKDLRRAWRNPIPWLINLVVPLLMTALIGLAFGGRSDTGALGRIRFAVVDEDQSVLSEILRGAANRHEGEQHFEAVFVDRQEALRQILEKDLSAAIVIPTNFMRNYFSGREKVELELIKNPAQSVHPAVLEELLGAGVTALNAIARNFQSEFPAWQSVLEGKQDYHQASVLVERTGEKLKAASKYINPPLVSYTRETNAAPAAGSGNGKAGGPGSKATISRAAGSGGGISGVFAFLLVGLAAMFLLFLGHTAVSDLHRELRLRTFERYQTLRSGLVPFLAGKMVYAVVALVLCAGVMLAGGGLVFRISWPHPLALAALSFGYACFVAALFSVLAALVPDERRAGVLNNMVGMALGLVGGCAFPARQLPGFLREHITPLLPTAWYVETARALQFGGAGPGWERVTLGFLLLGAVLIGVAAVLFRRRFSRGIRT